MKTFNIKIIADDDVSLRTITSIASLHIIGINGISNVVCEEIEISDKQNTEQNDFRGLTLGEINEKIEKTRTLKDYIELCVYRINNFIDTSPDLIVKSTEKRMIDRIRKFVQTEILSPEEFQNSYDLLIGGIYKINMSIKSLEDGLRYLEYQIIPGEKDHIEYQRINVEKNIKELKQKRAGYFLSINILIKSSE